MSETRVAVPFLTTLKWVLNPINVAVPVENSQSQRQQFRQGSLTQGLTIGMQPYIGNLPMGQVDYTFDPDQLSSLLSAIGVDVQANWATALSDMADVFPVLADPTLEQLDDGLHYDMQLDLWSAQFTPTGNSTVIATLGFYKQGVPKIKEDGTSSAVAYQELVFADAGIRQTRANNIAALQANITQQQSIIDGQDYTAEQKAQASQAKASYQKELDRMNAQLVGSMEALLGSEAVSTSIVALVGGVYNYLKANNSEWANVDVDGLLAAFVARFQSIIGA